MISKVASVGENTRLGNPRSVSRHFIGYMMTRRPGRGRYTDTYFAWIVVLGSFLVSIAQATNGIIISVLLDPFLIYFEESQTMLGILSAVRMSLFHGAGLVGGPLVQRFGPRPVAMAGILLCTAGTMMAAFTNTFLQVIVTFCIMGASGAGLLFIPASVIVHQYHEKNRALASSLASVGLSVASTSFPPIMRLSLDMFGWRGCLMTLSAVTLQCLVGAVLFMPNPPLKSGKSRCFHPKRDQFNSVLDKENNRLPESEQILDLTQVTNVPNTTIAESTVSMSTNPQGFRSSFRVFKNRLFVIFAVAMFPIQCGSSCYMYLSIQRAIDRGISRVSASFLPTAFGICAFTGRFTGGFLGNCQYSNRVLQMSISLMCGAVIMGCSVFCSDILSLHMAFAAAYGLAFGLTNAVLSTVMVDLVGVELLPTAMSAAQFSRAIASFSVMPLAGWLVDVTGDYTASYLVGGALQLTGGLLVMIIVVIRWRRRIKRPNEEVNVED